MDKDSIEKIVLQLNTQCHITHDEFLSVLAPLQTDLHTAMDNDNPVEMAEALLDHAQQIIWLRLHRRNPLNALEQGNLPQAWELADSYAGTCVNWYLLVAWSLKTQEQLPEARTTLQQLQAKHLEGGSWNNPGQAYLLAQTHEIDSEIFVDLCQRLQGYSPQVCAKLLAQGSIDAAMTLTEHLDDDRDLEWAVREITRAQRGIEEEGEAQKLLNTAFALAQRISNTVMRHNAFETIAISQLYTGNIVANLEAIRHMNTEWGRSLALGKIASLYNNGHETAQKFFAEVFEMVQHLKDESTQAALFERLVKAQAKIGDYPAALETVQKMPLEATKGWGLQAIAVAHARDGDYTQALETAHQIHDEQAKTWALKRIAELQAKTGETSTALQSIEQIGDIWREASALGDIALFQEHENQLAEAVKTIQRIENIEQQIHSLQMLAERQAQRGQYRQAQYLFAHAFSLGEYQEFRTEWEQATALKDIASTLALHKEEAKALEIVERIEHSMRNEYALRAFVETVAENGAFAIAHDVTLRIKEHRAQAEAFVSMVKAKVNQGELADAIEIAQGIEGQDKRSEAFQIIVEEYIRQEQYARAFELVQYMETDSTLRMIADLYAKNGDIPRAINIVHQMTSDWEQACVLGRIFQHGGRHEDLAEILELAQGMSFDQAQSVTLQAVAKAQARLGEYTTAFETVQRIHYEHVEPESRGWQIVAAAQASSGDIAEAFRTTQRIQNKHDYDSAFLAIVRAQVQCGDLDEALDTAQRMTSEWTQADAFIEIIEAHLQEGNYVSAENVAQQMKDYDNEITLYKKMPMLTQSGALQYIAEARMNDGDLSAALHTTHMIHDNETRIWTLTHIAKKLVEQGDRDSARDVLRTALDISPEQDYWQESRFERIAPLQFQAGWPEDALQTALSITKDQNKYLPKIARVVAETGDKEHFKSLLFPCAYFLDAAYAMCGELAQLYPEHAYRIADSVSKEFRIPEKFYEREIVEHK